MQINISINGKKYEDDLKPDTILLDYLREKGCYSVKRGCDTTNCGLCTVLVDGLPILSCAMLAVRCNNKSITTLEGIQEHAIEIGDYLATEGADQCGFCSPGLILNVYAMSKELTSPTEEEILHYLSGNLCRCTGYMGQLRGIIKYLGGKK